MKGRLKMKIDDLEEWIATSSESWFMQAQSQF